MADTTSAFSLSSYSLDCDDYNALCGLRDQLGFTVSLMCNCTEGQLQITTAELFAFCQLLGNVARQLIQKLDERQQASRSSQQLSWIDLNVMLKAASNPLTVPIQQLSDLKDKLELSVQAEPNMGYVYGTWVELITQKSAMTLDELTDLPPEHALAPAAKPKASRKRDKLMPASVA